MDKVLTLSVLGDLSDLAVDRGLANQPDIEEFSSLSKEILGCGFEAHHYLSVLVLHDRIDIIQRLLCLAKRADEFALIETIQACAIDYNRSCIEDLCRHTLRDNFEEIIKFYLSIRPWSEAEAHLKKIENSPNDTYTILLRHRFLASALDHIMVSGEVAETFKIIYGPNLESGIFRTNEQIPLPKDWMSPIDYVKRFLNKWGREKLILLLDRLSYTTKSLPNNPMIALLLQLINSKDANIALIQDPSFGLIFMKILQDLPSDTNYSNPRIQRLLYQVVSSPVGPDFIQRNRGWIYSYSLRSELLNLLIKDLLSYMGTIGGPVNLRKPWPIILALTRIIFEETDQMNFHWSHVASPWPNVLNLLLALPMENYEEVVSLVVRFLKRNEPQRNELLIREHNTQKRELLSDLCGIGRSLKIAFLNSEC